MSVAMCAGLANPAEQLDLRALFGVTFFGQQKSNKQRDGT